MDFLDICRGKFFQTHTGRFYEHLPTILSDGVKDTEDLYRIVSGIDVDYEYVDPTEWHYKTLLSNLTETKAASATIKTTEPLKYNPRAFFLLDNGRLCQMLSVTEDTAAAQREAARLMPVPIGTEYVIRLLEIENPWGI